MIVQLSDPPRRSSPGDRRNENNTGDGRRSSHRYNTRGTARSLMPPPMASSFLAMPPPLRHPQPKRLLQFNGQPAYLAFDIPGSAITPLQPVHAARHNTTSHSTHGLPPTRAYFPDYTTPYPSTGSQSTQYGFEGIVRPKQQLRRLEPWKTSACPSTDVQSSIPEEVAHPMYHSPRIVTRPPAEKQISQGVAQKIAYQQVAHQAPTNGISHDRRDSSIATPVPGHPGVGNGLLHKHDHAAPSPSQPPEHLPKSPSRICNPE